jgi:hypothetical protein
MQIEKTKEFKAAVKSAQIRATIARIGNMPKKSFAFRLSAIVAADSRPGKTWA